MYFTDKDLLESLDLMELTFYDFEMQKWNIATDRAQRVDEKNGVIRLVMFTPRLTVIKMSKMACFMYFLLDTAKNQSQNSERYLTASKWSYLALSENTMN